VSLAIGVIGTGNIGSYHIERLATRISGASVTGVFDVATDRAEAIAAQVGATAHRQAEDVIAADDVDAVVVTSPGPTHADLAIACIEAGKPVLSEKPIATTIEDCQRVLDAEVAHGQRLVQVGFMRRFDPGYLQIKAAIDDGTIGDVLLVHNVHRNPTVPDTFTSDMLQTDSVIHEIDTCRWLLGEELTAATVLTPRRSPEAASHLQDPQLVVFETERGVLVEVEMFVNARYGYDVRCEVVGSRGTAELETPVTGSLTADFARARRVPADWRERFDEAFHREIQGWVHDITAGGPSGPTTWDGTAATAVAVAGVQALETGERCPVQLPNRPDLYAPTVCARTRSAPK
jgi:myo-inositol 2-dehydrogenase / D-chiro-inositol 1-dehydrogenase